MKWTLFCQHSHSVMINANEMWGLTDINGGTIFSSKIEAIYLDTKSLAIIKVIIVLN